MSDSQQPAVCFREVTRRHRCPYCHDEVHAGGVQCGCCGARHHSACMWESPRCAACGYGLEEELNRVLLEEAEAREGWLRPRLDPDWMLRFGDLWRRRRHLYWPLVVTMASAVGVYLLVMIWRAVLRG